MSDVVEGHNRRRNSMIPIVQLAAAGAAFGGWAILGVAVEAEQQVLPIRSFAFSATLSLILTLGIPYLIPNLFRGLPIEARRGRGPWSRPLGFTAFAIASTAAVGAIAAVLGSPLIGTILANAALFSAGIVVLQLARLLSSLEYAAIGAASQVVVPFLWLGASTLFSSDHARGAAVAGVGSVGILVFLRSLAPLRPHLALRRLYLGSFARRALLLLPHLVAFSIIVQGLRILTSYSGTGETVISGHYLALGIAAGNTLLASLNSLFSVEIQAANDAQSQSLQRTLNMRIALSGLIASLVTVSAILGLKMSGVYPFPGLPPWVALLAGVSPIILSLYYLNSNLLVREGRTAILSTISVTAAALTGSVALLVRGSVPSLSVLTIIYGASIVGLALAATIAARRYRPGAGSLSYALTFASLVLYGLLVAAPTVTFLA